MAANGSAAFVETGGAVITRVPSGFVPDEDQGYVMILVQAPQGASLDYTMNVVKQVEQNLAGDKMTDEDLEELKSCARVFVNVNCTNTITEHKTYSYQKRRRLNLNYKERPRDFMDHIMDALGYYVWTNYRFEGRDEFSQRSYISEYEFSEEDVSPMPTAHPLLGPPPKPPAGFLAWCRDEFSADDSPAVELLR